jgi:hypothetical protein
MYLISDDRVEFKKVSFCGYKKKDLFSALKKQLEKRDPITTLKWACEAHASGWVAELFELYESFAVQMIGIGNPKLFAYLSQRREEVRMLIQGKQSFVQTQNDGKMRYIITEIPLVLIQSQRRPIPKLQKFKEDDLDQTRMIDRLMFYGKDYQKEYWNDDTDPQSLKGVFNEFIGSIRVSHLDSVIFWLSWIKMWEVTKNVMPVNDAPEECPLVYKSWFGWKPWKILRKESSNKLVEYLYQMSTRDIRGSNKRFREDCLILAIVIMCEKVDSTRPLVTDMEKVMGGCSSEMTDRIYRDLINERNKQRN